MCDEALVKFHNRRDRETLFILHTSYTTVANPIEPLPTGALEVILTVATSFSSRHGLELTCFAFYRPFSVSALVHLPHEEIIRTAAGGGSALGNRPYGYRNLPCDCGICSRRAGDGPGIMSRRLA